MSGMTLYDMPKNLYFILETLEPLNISKCESDMITFATKLSISYLKTLSMNQVLYYFKLGKVMIQETME